MKKKHFAFVTALVLCLGLLPAPALGAGSGTVTIDRDTFPDDAFRAVVQTLPGAEDGVFTSAELEKVTELQCNDRGITDLEGVDEFTSLRVLNCAGNHLTRLDVGGMPALVTLDCSRNFTLRELEADRCPALTTLDCTRNILTKLDVKGDPALRVLLCSCNWLPELNLSEVPALEELYCDENELIDLDLTRNPALTTLECYDNCMWELDVSQNRAISSLSADFMSYNMTIWVPAEGFTLKSLSLNPQAAGNLTGGSVNPNGIFTFAEGSDTATFLYMRNTVTLKKELTPVTWTATTAENAELTMTTDHRGRLSAVVKLPAGEDDLWVTVPMDKVTPGTVAIEVERDGSEDLMPTSYPVENGLRFLADDGMQVKLEDRTRRFYDVAHYEWFRPYVDFVSARKIFVGILPREFAPQTPMTRGMIVTVLRSLLDESAEKPAAFPDVKPEDWYAEGAAWAAEAGVAVGYPDGRFGPNDPVTREQLALMLYQAMGAPAVREEQLTFADRADVSPYALTAIRWAVQNGVLSGVGENRLNPGGTATRAEGAAMLMAYVKLMG